MKSIHGGDIYNNKVNMDFSVNINPLGIPHSVKEAMSDALSHADRYPDMACSGLKKAISEYFTQQGSSIQSEDVIPGNGASELFMAIAHAIKPQKAVLPAPGFFGYEHVLRAVGCDIGYFMLDEQSDFSPAARLDALMDMLTDDTDIFFIANPNNPTGYIADSTFMKQIIGHCKEKHIYVVADECFMGFCEKNYSVLSLLCDYDNLIVVRAFTKLFAIPGVRLGYMLSKNEALRQKVQRNLPEWNVSVLAQMAGDACIKESEYIKETASYVSGQRRLLSDGLKKLGFKVYKSDADFILFYSKLPLYDILLNKGILIRDCSNYVGLSQGYFRVAVKTFDENVRLLKVIGECIEKIKQLEPMEIEKRSFEIISHELSEMQITLPADQEMITKRVIHTSADFDYIQTLKYSKDAVAIAKRLISEGADIVTDTNMALSGINKKYLAKFGGQAHCFMADDEVALIAKEKKTTRAAVSMEFASRIDKPVIFAIGNAPTALIELYDMIEKGIYKPAFVIGVPVGFVNVEAAKEIIMETGVPYIVNVGRKGGSNIAAAICNALIYSLVDRG